MNSQSGRVALVGLLPKTVLQACWRAAASAGIFPVEVFRTSSRTAMVFGADGRPLFVRWPGRRTAAAEWAKDPTLFSPRHKAHSLQAMRALLADPGTLVTRVRIRRKTADLVS